MCGRLLARARTDRAAIIAFVLELDGLHQDRFERVWHNRFRFNVLEYAQIVRRRYDDRWIMAKGGRCRKHYIRYIARAAGASAGELINLFITCSASSGWFISCCINCSTSAGELTIFPISCNASVGELINWANTVSASSGDCDASGGFEPLVDDCKEATADESSSASEERELCGLLYAEELGVLLSSDGEAIRLTSLGPYSEDEELFQQSPPSNVSSDFSRFILVGTLVLPGVVSRSLVAVPASEALPLLSLFLARFCSIFFRFSTLSSSDMMYSFFMPIRKHFSSRHFWQKRRVTTVISQFSLNGHVNPLVDSALRRKKALQLSQVTALKL
uniref:Uncharacterized protein n=1 Tax=Anopheles maculatus TaxID=74869 RepID=A0A182SW79_9DIPT